MAHSPLDQFGGIEHSLMNKRFLVRITGFDWASIGLLASSGNLANAAAAAKRGQEFPPLLGALVACL